MNEIREALSRLEKDCETSKCIADKLLEMGFVGGHGNWNCPVAKYLQAETGFKDVTVGMTTAVYGSSLFQLPPNVAKFIWQFDRGAFPKLDIIRYP